MTTYNTGNPIGSTDARDRLDNTENMDYLENSTTELTHPDRLGNVRRTRHGMEVEHDAQISAHESEHDNQIAAHEIEHDAQITAHEVEHDNQMQSFENDFDSRLAGMAFTRVGTFTAGATLTDMRQTLLWEVSQGGDGHEYGWTGSFLPSGKVVAAGSTPATSGGVGAGSWVDRTDDSLRDELEPRIETSEKNIEDLSALSFKVLRRSYAEAGYNLVDGSFEAGGTVTSVTDVLLYEATGIAYLWLGALPKVVPAGSTPASTGGIDSGAWVGATHSNVEDKRYIVGFSSLQNMIDGVTTLNQGGVKHSVGNQYVVNGSIYECLTSETPAPNGINDFKNTSLVNINDSTTTKMLSLVQSPLANHFRTKSTISTSRKHISIIGDSISQGAYSRDIFRKNWTNILKRNVNAERGERNFGFGTTWPYAGTGETESSDFYDVDAIPSTSYWQLKQGVYASDSPNGLYRYREGIAGDTLRFTIPMINRRVKIYFQKGPSFGSFEVHRNGVVVDTQNSDIVTGGYTTGFNDTAIIELEGKDGTGVCEIDIVKLDGNYVAISGLHLENEANGFSVDNFSHSGRKLREASELVLAQIIQRSEVLICALGHNDRGTNDSNPLLLAEFQQRLDWIKQYSIQYKCKVVFLDFCWNVQFDTSPTRQAIKSYGDIIPNAVYVPLPENFSPSIGVDNVNPNSDPSWNLFDDPSHPNENGHKLIGDVVSKILGLSCNSGSTVENDFWYPLTLPAGLKNNDAGQTTISAYKEDKDKVVLRFRVKASSGGPIPPGSYTLFDGKGFYNPFTQPAMYLSDDITNDEARRVPAVLQINNVGVVVLRVQNSNNQNTINGQCIIYKHYDKA